jgi:hypothetical protein
MRGKKEEKVRIRIYLPKELYAELRERQLYDHASFLFARLLEEFFKTDVRISWSTLTNRKEQREFLEKKLQEFLSRAPQSLPKQEQQVGKQIEQTKQQVEEQSTHEQKVNVDEIKIDYDQFW